MFISTTTLTSSPSDLTAVGQKQEACSSIGLLARQSPSDRPLTTPSSTTLSMAIRQPNWSEADTLFTRNAALLVPQIRRLKEQRDAALHRVGELEQRLADLTSVKRRPAGETPLDREQVVAEAVARALAAVRAEYTSLPRFGYHLPLD